MLLLKPDPIQYTRGKWPKLNKKRAGFYATKWATWSDSSVLSCVKHSLIFFTMTAENEKFPGQSPQKTRFTYSRENLDIYTMRTGPSYVVN